MNFLKVRKVLGILLGILLRVAWSLCVIATVWSYQGKKALASNCWENEASLIFIIIMPIVLVILMTHAAEEFAPNISRKE